MVNINAQFIGVIQLLRVSQDYKAHLSILKRVNYIGDNKLIPIIDSIHVSTTSYN